MKRIIDSSERIIEEALASIEKNVFFEMQRNEREKENIEEFGRNLKKTLNNFFKEYKEKYRTSNKYYNKVQKQKDIDDIER